MTRVLDPPHDTRTRDERVRVLVIMYADVSFANFADQALGLTCVVCEGSRGRTPFYDSLFVRETRPLLD